MNSLLYFIFYLIILFVLMLLYFRVADKFNIIDRPNERSSHKQVTLLGGGIIFYLAILGYFFVNGFQYPWFFLGLTMIAIVSFIDDIKPQSYKIRLVVHLISILLLFYESGLFVFPWYFTLIALVLSVGILNAYNFMDGINGMIGLYSTVVMVSMWYINQYVYTFIDEQIIYYVLLALVVFNFFNFRTKARCFAGDVGALSLAFVVVFLLCILILKTGNIIWIGLLTVFGVDTILTIIHRLLLRENIFEAHRKHLFQLLVNELGFSHISVSIIYATVQMLVSAGLILFRHHTGLFLISAIFFLSIVYYVLKHKYFHLYQPYNKKHKN